MLPGTCEQCLEAQLSIQHSSSAVSQRVLGRRFAPAPEPQAGFLEELACQGGDKRGHVRVALKIGR